MPAFCTHYVFAKEMIPTIKKEYPSLNINKDAVFLGAQGPDVFFFHRACPWMKGKAMRNIGSDIHRAKPEILFDSMADYFKKNGKNSIALSYCYGFIMHYSLDRICHPYVYAMQEKLIKQNKLWNPHTAHNTIELSLDTYILNHELNMEHPEKFDTYNTITTSRAVIVAASDIFFEAFSKSIKDTFDILDVRTAFNDTKYLQKYLHDEKGTLRKALRGAEDIIYPYVKGFRVSSLIRPKDLEKTKKYANIDNSLWVSPFENGKRTESFLDLFNKAKSDTMSLIKGFNNIICGNSNGKEVTKNISFLTGVEI